MEIVRRDLCLYLGAYLKSKKNPLDCGEGWEGKVMR